MRRRPWTHDGLFIPLPPTRQTRSVNQAFMGGLLRIAGFGGSAAVLVGGLIVTPPGHTQTQPMQLLTDTPHYCAELFAEVEATRQALLEPAPPAVERLALEGQQLCSLGEVQGGVIRLRRAMVLLHKSSGQN